MRWLFCFALFASWLCAPRLMLSWGHSQPSFQILLLFLVFLFLLVFSSHVGYTLWLSHHLWMFCVVWFFSLFFSFQDFFPHVLSLRHSLLSRVQSSKPAEGILHFCSSILSLALCCCSFSGFALLRFRCPSVLGRHLLRLHERRAY